MNEENKLQISGFWPRVGAFLVDIVILGLFGNILGILFNDFFVLIGVWGVLLGFTIAAAYFSLMNSNISEGRTLGKEIFKIQVVKKDGSYLTPLQSFFRYSIISVPYFLNNSRIFEFKSFSALNHLLILIVFGFGLSIFYLAVFNKKTRQSLHDIIIGTYVVKKNMNQQVETEPVWFVHYIAIAVISLCSLLAPLFMDNLVNSDNLIGYDQSRFRIVEIEEVVHAGITNGISTFISGKTNRTTKYITVEASLNIKKIKNDDIAIKIAKIVLEQLPDAHNKDVIKVVLEYGYDIGIASSRIKYNFSLSPKEWNNKTIIPTYKY